MEVNVKSMYRCAKAVLRPMMKQRSGRIINITSVIGLMGNAGQANYAAAKAAVIGFTKSLTKEAASRGITVNAIAPGYIATDMTDVSTRKCGSELSKRFRSEQSVNPRMSLMPLYFWPAMRHGTLPDTRWWSTAVLSCVKFRYVNFYTNQSAGGLLNSYGYVRTSEGIGSGAARCRGRRSDARSFFRRRSRLTLWTSLSSSWRSKRNLISKFRMRMPRKLRPSATW